MAGKKKHKCCPHCGGTKGFEIRVNMGGYYEIKSSFDGEILFEEKHGNNVIESDGECLDCGKLIGIEKLKVEDL